MTRTVLLNPGPVNVTERVKLALLRGDLCHREKECEQLISCIRRKLLEAFQIQDQFESVLISGSGTAALEMAVSSSLSKNKKLLVVQNGVYGERIAKIAVCYDLPHESVIYPWGCPPDLKEIELRLQSHPEIEVVAMVHHETTTGLLNPIGEVGGLVKQYQKKFLVDCISSLGGDFIDFEGWNIDFSVGTANKCLQGFPGVSFVLFRKEEADRLPLTPSRSLYFNLMENFKAQKKGVPLFTPAVQAHYALDEALDELIEETVATRIRRYRKAAQFLRNHFEAMGLQFLIPRESFSNSLTSIKMPEGIPYQDLHDRLKEKGFVIYAGQGNFIDSIFRVANMGDIRMEEFERFIQVLKECFHVPSDS